MINPVPAATPAQKSFLATASVLVVLAAIALITVSWPASLSGSDAYGFVTVIAGGTAVAGGIALVSPSSSTVPHLALLLAVLAMTIVLVARGIWGAAEVKGIFGFILGGGTIGAGTGVANRRFAAINQARAEESAGRTEPSPTPDG